MTKAPHLAQFQFRKPEQPPDLWGGYLALPPTHLKILTPCPSFQPERGRLLARPTQKVNA